MTYQPYPAGTLLIPSGAGGGSHLYIVMTNVCKGGFHLLLSVSTIREKAHHDPTCTFRGGEHAFIKHASYIVYRLPQQTLNSDICSHVKRSYYIDKGALAAEEFRRVCEGVDRSDFSSPWMKRYFRENSGTSA